MQMDNTKLAMLLIAVIEIIALLRGIDGALLSTVVAIIAGLGGYHYGKEKGR